MLRFPSKLIPSLQKQIYFEMKASQTYLFFSNWSFTNNYPGMGKFFRHESEEEYSHGLEIINYMILRKELPQLPTIEQIDVKIENVFDLFNIYLKTEHENLKNLDNLSKESHEIDDFITASMLSKMINEQLNGLMKAKNLHARASSYSKHGNGALFYHLDKELNKSSSI